MTHFANDKRMATCNKCGATSQGAAGCSHASCGGIFIIAKLQSRRSVPRKGFNAYTVQMAYFDDVVTVYAVDMEDAQEVAEMAFPDTLIESIEREAE